MASEIRIPPPFRPPFKTGYDMGHTVVDSHGAELVCFDYENGQELAEFVTACINRATQEAPCTEA